MSHWGTVGAHWGTVSVPLGHGKCPAGARWVSHWPTRGALENALRAKLPVVARYTRTTGYRTCRLRPRSARCAGAIAQSTDNRQHGEAGLLPALRNADLRQARLNLGIPGSRSAADFREAVDGSMVYVRRRNWQIPCLSSEPAGVQTAHQTMRCRVLLVDDEQPVLFATARCLSAIVLSKPASLPVLAATMRALMAQA